MNADRLRYLIDRAKGQNGKWTLDDAGELVKSTHAILRQLDALKPFAMYARHMQEQWKHHDDSAYYGVKQEGAPKVTYGDFREAYNAWLFAR